MPPSAADYRPRDAEHAVLYRVIAENLEAFLETAKRHADGSSLPEFVEQEFRDFLTCGRLAHGFARLRCADCAVERLVPFSCKGRGFCPSCGGRRLTECAARLVHEVPRGHRARKRDAHRVTRRVARTEGPLGTPRTRAISRSATAAPGRDERRGVWGPFP